MVVKLMNFNFENKMIYATASFLIICNLILFKGTLVGCNCLDQVKKKKFKVTITMNRTSVSVAWNILRTKIFKFVQINSLGLQIATP